MKLRHHLFWFPGSLLFFLVITCPVRAQIIEDETLPSPSIVTPTDNTSIITGGTQAGSNLFHSFREFSVPPGASASFQQVGQEIKNIISRVTGSNASNIDGLIETLEANGTVSKANFFLLNPNGIIFGPKASLSIGGSFIASTASSLNFADGTQLITTAPQTIPLLTVSVPFGLQYGNNPRSILVQGTRSEPIDTTSGLRVQSNQTLALVGGIVALEGGTLTTAGGRIELGSVASPSLVILNLIDKGWALGYQNVSTFGDIQLSQQAAVDASGKGGGDVLIQGRHITLTNGSFIEASTLGPDSGGILAVTATDSVELSGSFPTGLFALVYEEATGTGGNSTIKAGHLSINNGARVETSTAGLGKAGNLTIQTGQLIIRDGGQVLSNTYDQGQAGNLTVQNAAAVELIGGIVVEGKYLPSGLFTQVSPKAIGHGGDLSISTEKLIVQEGAQVNSTTLGVGDAGDLIVRATDIELVGAALTADGKLLINEKFGLAYGSGLFAGTDVSSVGNGGSLMVEADRLSLRDGAVVQTATCGEGDAGDLTVRATDTVELVGTFADDRFPTSLGAYSGGIPGLRGVVEAKGQGGDLTIETRELIVRDRAAVAVSSLNQASGNLRVQAQTIRLENEGELTAATASGQGGDITLLVQDLLLLRRGSQISTTAGAGGNGGNININNITGISYIDALLSGQVIINTPEVNPSQGLVDASGLIAQTCPAGGGQGQSEFIVTGRGGLPEKPSEALSSDAIEVDLVTLNSKVENRSSPISTNPTAPAPTQIVEAQGWVTNDMGEVVLTAQAPNATLHIPWLAPAGCHTPQASS